jgi:hypothetical protein
MNKLPDSLIYLKLRYRNNQKMDHLRPNIMLEFYYS